MVSSSAIKYLWRPRSFIVCLLHLSGLSYRCMTLQTGMIRACYRSVHYCVQNLKSMTSKAQKKHRRIVAMDETKLEIEVEEMLVKLCGWGCWEGVDRRVGGIALPRTSPYLVQLTTWPAQPNSRNAKHILKRVFRAICRSTECDEDHSAGNSSNTIGGEVDSRRSTRNRDLRPPRWANAGRSLFLHICLSPAASEST